MVWILSLWQDYYYEIITWCLHVDIDVVEFLSSPMVIREDDDYVQILVGVKFSDGPFNNDTIARLSIDDQSEGMWLCFHCACSHDLNTEFNSHNIIIKVQWTLS